MPSDEPVGTLQQAGKDGRFHRQNAQFRNYISADPNADFPAEDGRYVLYLNWGCPWAHRTNIVRSLKGLESIIQLVVCGFELTKEGWLFDGLDGSDPRDPLYGFTKISELYHKADPEYSLRYTVPLLWDKKKETIVSNESSEIIRMFYSEFDHLLPAEKQEINHPGGGLLPKKLKGEIEAMNEWVYSTVNNGVYKTGFADTQAAYEENVYPLFESLDRLEAHLGEPAHQPYLFGKYITEADVRLYTTLIRFDTAYVTIFKCNLRMIRDAYPNLDRWLRRLYWDEGPETSGGAFKKTTHIGIFKKGYAVAAKWPVVPAGPKPDVLPPLEVA
ncbi:MAG: hypothetical protein M1828_003257 [Chrysothrix sp. TS-e1954]|nr:MAG: hypothetical protein M1828_003257 [Chrysothrix sp. TS-e1954]